MFPCIVLTGQYGERGRERERKREREGFKCVIHFLPSTDRKACENIQGKPVDLAYNVTSFVWRPELGSKVKMRSVVYS